MNKSTLLLSLVALCLLLALGYVALKDPAPAAVSSEKERGPLIKDFTPDAVTAITLKRGDVVVELKKKGKEWTMPQQKNRAALESRITTLLNDLKDARSTGTRGGKNMADFDLTPEKRTELTIERETGATKLLLGKTLPGGMSSVAQRDPSGPILEIDRNLPERASVQETKGVVTLNPSLFYDLKIFSDKIDDAIDVVVKRGNEITRIQKVIPGKGPVAPKQEVAATDKPVWWVTEPEGGAADEGKMGSVTSTVLNLNAKEYAEDVPEKERGLDKPSAKILVRLKDGSERSITFGKVDPQGVIVSVSGRPDVFKVEQYIYDTCTKTDDMKKKEEPPAPPENPSSNLKPPVNPPPPVPPPQIKPPTIPPPPDKNQPPTIPPPADKNAPPTIPPPAEKPKDKENK